MVSGFSPELPKDLMKSQLRKSPALQGARREKEVKERGEERDVQDARTQGFKSGQQQKTHCPLVYTQPHPSYRPGPAHYSSPNSPHHHHHPYPLLSILSISALIETNYTHYHLEWKERKKRRLEAPVLYSSCWINWVNNRQLGANLQTLCRITRRWMWCVRLHTHCDVTEMRGRDNQHLACQTQTRVCDRESWPSAEAQHVITAHM